MQFGAGPKESHIWNFVVEVGYILSTGGTCLDREMKNSGFPLFAEDTRTPAYFSVHLAWGPCVTSCVGVIKFPVM